MANLPKPSDLLNKGLPKPQDLLEKKNAIQNGSSTGSKTLFSGSKPFQTQVDTKVPSVLTEKGATEYKERVKDYAPPVQKVSKKPKSLTEAVSNDDSYIGAMWNQIPNAVSDFVGGLSKFVGKGVAQMYGKPVELLLDVVNKTSGQNIVNPIKEFTTDEKIESVGKFGEKAVKKLRTSASSEDYERKIQEGFDITDGFGVQDVKAIPVMLTRIVADAGLSIPTGGLAFVAQGYNQGLNEYDEAVKNIPKELRNDKARDIFAVLYGTVNGLADKAGLDFMTKAKPVSNTIKKFIIKEAVKELAEKEAKNVTSDIIEKTIENIAKKTFNKVKTVGVRTAIGATGEGVTESIQGGLSDGLKILTNKISDNDVFDVEDVKRNFWKSRINDAAGGFVLGGTLGGAMNSLKSTDSYISERVAESTTPEQIQALKEELVNSVDDNGNPLLDEEKINILNQAIDKYSDANQKLPAGLSTEKRAKALQLISERDEIKASREGAIQNASNVDEAIQPEVEGDVVIFENKEQQKNDEIRELFTGNKYKYYQDEDGKFFKQLGNGKPEEITQEYFNLQNQDKELPTESTTAQPTDEIKLNLEIPYNPLMNVESTAKALTDDMVQELGNKLGKLFPLSEDTNTNIAKEYHKAKVDGSNPQLVEAVEELLKPKEDAIQEPSATTEIPRTRETGGVITESSEGVRPSEQGKEVTEEGKQEEVAPVKPIEELKQDVKKAKGKAGKTSALQTLKENSTPEEFQAFMDENPAYKKYEPKEASKAETEQEITDETEIDLPSEKKVTAKEKLAELEKQKNELLKKIRKAGTNLSSGFNPEVISDLAKLGAIYIQQGVITFKEFAKQLKTDYGKEIPDDVLRDVYRKSAKTLGLGVRKTPERIATGEAVSDNLREIADETESLYQQQNYKEVQERLDNMSEAEKNALVGTLANVTGQLNAEGNIGVLAAIDLINMYEANGDTAGAQRVFDTISKSATAFAQLLRQYGQLKSSTPQGYVSIVTKHMKDKYGVDLTDAQKQAIEKLYNESKQALNNQVDALNDLADNLTDPNYDAKKGYKVWGATTVKLEDANRKLDDFIDSLKPATSETFFQKLTSIVQGGLLSIKSLLVNPFANAIQASSDVSKNEVGNLFDFIVSLTFGTKRTKVTTFKPQAIKLGAQAMGRGLSKANRMLLKGSADTEMAKFDVGSRLKPVNAWKSLYKTLSGKQAFSVVKMFEDLAEGTIGISANLALRLLPYGDLPRNEQARVAKLFEIGTNKFGLKGKELEAFILRPDPDSLAEAQEYGDKSTLQNSNEIYNLINNAINKIGKNADNKFLKGLYNSTKFAIRGLTVPFLKTPINYAVKAVRFTNPIIPYMQAAYQMFMFSNSIITIKNPKLKEAALRKHQSKMTEYLGEAIVAQSVMSAAYILIGYGLVTGDAPKEDEEKKEKDLMYKTLPPNSINISGLKRLLSGGDPTYIPGDTGIAYSAFGILGAQLGISSSTVTSEEKEKIRKAKYVTTEGKPFYKENDGFYFSGIMAMTSNLPASLNFTLNQGFAQGTGALLDAVKEKKYSSWSNQMVKTLFTGLAVPNTAYQSFKAADEYYRNVYTEDQVETWGNIVKERYGDIEGLPINYDMWGKPIRLTPEGSNPYVYHVLDIFRTQKILQDKNTYYVFDLYKKTGDKSVIPSSVSDIIGEEGGVYDKLKADQKSELQRIVGEERAKYINGDKGSALSMKNYDPNNNNEEYWEKQVNKLKSAYKLGLKKGKIRFQKEVLNKNKQ